MADTYEKDINFVLNLCICPVINVNGAIIRIFN